MVNYNLRYFAEYENRNNSFRLEILNAKTLINSEVEISAYCKLSYKRADSIFTPIRGAILEININSSISNQFSEFLSFNERDYKVRFFKNQELIFEGFINPVGITQSYSSVNWVARLVATDNLGTLKNLEFIYQNELPNEFVFLDLILKRTGLDLPIAFADSLLSDGLPLANSFNRIIDPEVFLNKNERQANCESILKDILIKYNASICLRSLPIYDLNNNFVENKLCWMFYRNIDLINFSQTQAQIPVYKINSYNESTSPVFGTILNPVFAFLGVALNTNQTIASENLGLKSNAILVNRNAQLRSINSLQNFRFEQKWVERGSLLNFDENFLDFDGDPNATIVNNLKRQDFLSFNEGNPVFGNIGFGLFLMETIYDKFVKSSFDISLPIGALNLNVQGNVLIKSSSFELSLLLQQFKMFYTSKNGTEYVLRAIFTDENPFQTPLNEIGKQWQLLSEAELTSVVFYNHYLFRGNVPQGNSEINFKIEIPTLPDNGGFIRFEFPFLLARNETPLQPQFWNNVFAEFRELNLIAEANPELGTGEFHDAIRLNFESTNLEDAQQVINADEPTELFRNGLKRIENNQLVNYSEWKSVFFNETYPNLLQLSSLERLRLRRKNSIVLSSDIFGFINFGSVVRFLDFPDKFFVILDYNYNSVDDISRIEIAEIFTEGTNQNIEYNQSYIIENEVNVLIKS